MTAVDHISAPARAVSFIANTGLWGGSSGAILGWLSGQSLLGWIGAGCAVAGVVLSWHHKRELRRIERDRLELDRARFERENRNG